MCLPDSVSSKSSLEIDWKCFIVMLIFSNADSVRSKARRAAWSQDGDIPNYNPFARTRSNDRRPIEDEESNVGRRHSDTHLEPTIVEHRRAESRQAEKEFPAPHHADTAPPTSATSEKPHGIDLANKIVENGESSSPVGTSKQSADTNDTFVPVQRSGFRNRMKFRNILRKDTEEDSDDGLQRTNTGVSEKSVKRKAALARKIPVMNQVRAALFGSWINVLLIMVPAGFAVNYAHLNGIVVFVVNFIAIIPLAATLSYATEELALRVGETLGGLLNASFGCVSQPPSRFS
jgi:Ca2+:H+ antiporter